MKNPYKVLGVKDNAPLADCKKAYLDLCKKYHPDCLTGDVSKFKEVNKSWNDIKLGVQVVLTSCQKILRHTSLFTFEVYDN